MRTILRCLYSQGTLIKSALYQRSYRDAYNISSGLNQNSPDALQVRDSATFHQIMSP